MSVKRFLCMLICSSALMYPLTSSAYYIIHLKNGRQVTTSTYWTHDHAILFYIYGGVAGIEERLVSNISENDASSGMEVYVEEKVKNLDISKVNTQQSDAKILDIEDAKKKREAIKKQLDNVLEKYREVSSKQDADGRETLRQEITALSKKIFDITDNVKQKNHGRLPEGWEQP